MKKIPKEFREQFPGIVHEWGDGDDITDARKFKRRVQATRKKEVHNHGFDCTHCAGWVPIHAEMGTHNRNHCPSCLWSKHVDGEKSGGRKSDCHAPMEPIALTFKDTKPNKYASADEIAVGALMVVHHCRGDDGSLRINQLAADDNPEVALRIFKSSSHLSEYVLNGLSEAGIQIALPSMANMVMRQLFGVVRVDGLGI